MVLCRHRAYCSRKFDSVSLMPPSSVQEAMPALPQQWPMVSRRISRQWCIVVSLEVVEWRRSRPLFVRRPFDCNRLVSAMLTRKGHLSSLAARNFGQCSMWRLAVQSARVVRACCLPCAGLLTCAAAAVRPGRCVQW